MCDMKGLEPKWRCMEINESAGLLVYRIISPSHYSENNTVTLESIQGSQAHSPPLPFELVGSGSPVCILSSMAQQRPDQCSARSGRIKHGAHESGHNPMDDASIVVPAKRDHQHTPVLQTLLGVP